MEVTSSILARGTTPVVWIAHGAVWLLAALGARLSRTGSMLELHTTGRNGAALALWRFSPRTVRWLTLIITVMCVLVYVAGHGVG